MQAQLFTEERAITQSSTLLLFAVIPAIHMAKMVIIMLSISEKSFLFPWLSSVFELGCLYDDIFQLPVMNWLSISDL